MDAKSFFAELKRRNVFKVAIAYAVIAWLLIETASVFLYGHDERKSLVTALVIIFSAGFLLILYISWAFEATPEGLQRTVAITPDVAAALPTWSRRKFTVFIIGIALLALGLLVFDTIRSQGSPATHHSPPATDTAP